MSTAPTENENTPPAAPTARQLLVEWANRQDAWVRRLALEVLAAGRPASEEVLNSVYDHFLAEKGLAESTPPAVPPLQIQEQLDPGSGEFIFRSLAGVSGVNALIEDQEIEFNRGLTVLFGENGAGKTGYARILKRLADVRTAEQILPNVHEPIPAAEQEATIGYSVGGEDHVLQWKGETGISPMTHVSVFDSPAVRLHVDDDLAYVYTPRDLALFRAVNEGIDAIRSRGEEGVKARRPPSSPYLALFPRETAVYTHVETLGPATDLPALQALAIVPPEEEESADLLRTTVAALQSDSIQAQLTAARGRRQLYSDLSEAASAGASFDAEAYNNAVAAAKTAADAYAALRTELLATAGIAGESEEAWQDFVLKGEAYRKHLKADHYPTYGEPCLYCRQALDSDAVALLARYREFATDSARQRIEDARVQIATLSRGLLAVDRPALVAELNRHREDDEKEQALADASAYLVLLDEQMLSLGAQQAVDWSKLASTAATVKTEALARHAAAESLVKDLNTRSGDRAAKLQSDSAKLAELEARLELKKRLPDLETYVGNAKWAQRLEQLIRKFPALLRSLTDVSKTASEQLLNADFERRFGDECKVLRAPDVRLEFPGRRGQPARRKVVSAEHRPSQVLSEGEQKVIALADFLAEAALRLIPAPVVFDDPVNSLDYRRIREVASRIAKLASGRQVIVFTHSIWLATELLAHFEKQKHRCSYYSVTDEGGNGVIVEGAHPRWDTPKNISKTINGLITSAKESEGDAREAIVEKGYSWIRSWCEVVVEQELLRGVTRRFEANVRMTLLPQIKGDRLAAAEAVITPIFEKACRVMEGHSQPLETLSIRPTLEALEKEWSELQGALAAYRA